MEPMFSPGEHLHFLLVADQIEPPFVHMDYVQRRLERLEMAVDLVKNEVHTTLLLVKRKPWRGVMYC